MKRLMSKWRGIIKLIGILIIHNGLFAQNGRTITGNVQTAEGAPIIAATVHLLNTPQSVMTDSTGTFQLTFLPGSDPTLQITRIGYASAVVTIPNGQTQPIIVTMTADALQLDELLVSARKSEEPQRLLPLAITSFNSKRVADFRLWNIGDLSGIVPNLLAGSPGDGRDVVSIRGIVSTSYDPAVATYIDGVSQFSLDSYIPYLFDVERIEVLRGPQGTLYGRNASAGVINIITRKPGAKANGFAELSVGNYGQQRYSAGLRVPLKANLQAGAALTYTGRDGFYTNDFNGQSYDRQHAFIGNYFLRYQPGERWQWDLNVKHQANRNHGPFPLASSREEAEAHPFEVNQNALAQMIDNTLNGSLQLKYQGNHFQFSSQTAYQQNYRYYDHPLDGDFSPIDGITIINDYGPDWNKVKVWTQELRFSSTTKETSHWNWNAGIYGFLQRVPNRQATHFGEDAELVGSPDKNYSIRTTGTGRNRGVALYAQTQWSPTAKWRLLAGIRYDLEHKRQQVQSDYLVDGIDDPVFALQPDSSAAANFHAISPTASIQYLFSDQLNSFIRYSRGFRAGGFTQVAPDPSQLPLYKYEPENSNSFEWGLNGLFLDKRLQTNVSLFYTSIGNVQVPALLLPHAFVVPRNARVLHSKGIDLELAAKAWPGMTAEATAGFTDARYQSLNIPVDGDVVDLKDNRQLFTPRYTSMLALQQQCYFSKDHAWSITLRGEWLAKGNYYFDLRNRIEQKAYSVVNAALSVQWKQVSVKGWIRNLGDRKYLQYAYDFGAVRLGDPRNYGVSLLLQW